MLCVGGVAALLLCCDVVFSEAEMEIDQSVLLSGLPSLLPPHQLLKKRSSPHSSDEESHTQFYMMSSEDDSSEGGGEDSMEDTPEAESSEEDLDEEQGEALYRKRYWFLKRLAKRIIFVCQGERWS